jgi:hypothetical protein
MLAPSSATVRIAAQVAERGAERSSLMISEQTTLWTSPRTVMTDTWRAPLRHHQLPGIRAMAHRLTRAVSGWASVPVLPHAALWEASALLSLLNERESFPPDPYATEMPFLTDSWPHGSP